MGTWAAATTPRRQKAIEIPVPALVAKAEEYKAKQAAIANIYRAKAAPVKKVKVDIKKPDILAPS